MGLHKLADNCGACGEEQPNNELQNVSLRGITWKVKLCRACMERDILSDYNEAAAYIDNDTLEKYQGVAYTLKKLSKDE